MIDREKLDAFLTEMYVTSEKEPAPGGFSQYRVGLSDAYFMVREHLRQGEFNA